MAEHGGRYARVAEQLTKAGYAVYCGDLRGHGHTAATPGDLGYFADHDGFRVVLEDLHRIHERIAADHPGLPIYLLGHSMGSFFTQHYLFTYGAELAGAVLSGTSGGLAPLPQLGRIVAAAERARLGARGRSSLLHTLSLLGYNLGIKPRRSEHDWISSDPDEVDKYAADPLCGFVFTVQAWSDLYGGLIEMERPENVQRIPRSLPVYFFSGAADPVGRKTRGVRYVIDAYKKAGLTDISEHFYPGGRHEMLNERNRAEVFRDLIAWLDAAFARRKRPQS
jgi:alpha-beta hydrolase superfamily lysophospholipase